MKKKRFGLILAGVCAGAVNGLFGAGGGMLLVPLLTLVAGLSAEEVFPTSVSVILPICLVSLFFSSGWNDISFGKVLPYLIGSGLGGVLAGFLGKRIPVKWLHRILGVLILWGGIRYLC